MYRPLVGYRDELQRVRWLVYFTWLSALSKCCKDPFQMEPVTRYLSEDFDNRPFAYKPIKTPLPPASQGVSPE